jgi:hypothetical protein
MSGRDAAITVGILADKHLDYTIGRRGSSIAIQQDNRQQRVQVDLTAEELREAYRQAFPHGLPIEELRALRDHFRAQKAED